MALDQGVQNREVSFPADHWFHPDAQIEWFYFWGKLENGGFFHFARFWAKLGGFRTGASHFSFHDKGKVSFDESLEDDFGITKDSCCYAVGGKREAERFSFNAKKLGVVSFPQCNPIIHNTKLDRNYYSIPWMKGEAVLYPDKKITADVWFDHEFSPVYSFKNWEWVAVKLNCGLSIMAYKSDLESFCSVDFKGNRIETDFILDGKHLYINQLASSFMLEPKEEEVIFHPQFGVPYSEVPFEVISGGEIIGYGMRECTHRKEKENA